MAGIGDLNSIHNVSRCLRWNLWVPHSLLHDRGFEVQQDIRKMCDIYEKRMKTGKIED